jgi:hypothetical protein
VGRRRRPGVIGFVGGWSMVGISQYLDARMRVDQRWRMIILVETWSLWESDRRPEGTCLADPE